MVIRKEYDIEKLSKELESIINVAKEKHVYFVDIPLDTAINISDVLKETLDREKKHKTLESALTFMEMEDGTQTNEMEEYNGCKKPDCYSEITGCYEVCERCSYNKTCVFRVGEKEKSNIDKYKSEHEEVLPICFGKYGKHIEGETHKIVCRNKDCKYKKECREYYSKNG